MLIHTFHKLGINCIFKTNKYILNFAINSDLQESCKDNKFKYILHSASLNVNILHNCGILVKTKKLITILTKLEPVFRFDPFFH